MHSGLAMLGYHHHLVYLCPLQRISLTECPSRNHDAAYDTDRLGVLVFYSANRVRHLSSSPCTSIAYRGDCFFSLLSTQHGAIDDGAILVKIRASPFLKGAVISSQQCTLISKAQAASPASTEWIPLPVSLLPVYDAELVAHCLRFRD